MTGRSELALLRNSILLIGSWGLILFSTPAIGVPIFPDKPNEIGFPVQDAKYVLFVVLAANDGSEPCIDELEVYGPQADRNLALAESGAEATASSCLPGHAIHRIEHLNDGEFGNGHSWIAAGRGVEWAQVILPEATSVSKVVFSRDRHGVFRDRTPVVFEIRLSLDGSDWQTVRKVSSASASGVGHIPSPPPPPDGIQMETLDLGCEEDLLRYAFLGEEHAWLKTNGRADLSPRLVPYNGRVKEYPRHVGDDRLPLPPLSSGPKLDGLMDDACWREASCGVVRVTFPYNFEESPLVCHNLSAGRDAENLYLFLDIDRLLSGHVAVVSTSDLQGCGAVTCTTAGLVFNTYTQNGTVVGSIPVEGAFDKAMKRFEMRLPLSLFPECGELGIRVGLGMGGKHTPNRGRPIEFVFSPLSLAQVGECVDGTFQLRLGAPGLVSGEDPGTRKTLSVRKEGEALLEKIVTGPGDETTLSVPAANGPIGPECNLTIEVDGEEAFALHLFQYDPLQRTLDLMEGIVERLALKGLDTQRERSLLDRFRKQQAGFRSAEERNPKAERKALWEARVVKRHLQMRDPDLEPACRILFVKRRQFLPSHNYSVCLDAPFRPGGGICVLEIPRQGDRLDPAMAEVTTLFDAGDGIARTPMANFEADRIHFAYRPSEEGYYHVLSMNPDGSNLNQITDGPFHDYWPCPLPDGGLAFISTRCKCRYLCWRPQAAVMFRMDPDGRNMRPLSFANLSEWAPSVMSDGRLIWTRSEYIDKGADFSHTLWAIRPDGTKPELVFGNTIIQPNGYANGREVPETNEICCTLISHFGDLNGPIVLIDIDKGRFNPEAIKSITPEVPWPGFWPNEECFRDPVPISRDHVLCSHAPRKRFGIYLIDRYGNREVLSMEPDISSMCPTPFRKRERPPVLADVEPTGEATGEFVLADVYRGIEPTVKRGTVKYLRVVEEVRDSLKQLPSGDYQKDHEPFMNLYASPVDLVSGPSGWPTYVAKNPRGIVPVEEDGSARFSAPAGKTLYFQILDKDFNEIQRMRSVVQIQPGEKRSCIGCHEHRRMAPPNTRKLMAQVAHDPQPAEWGAKPFSYAEVVQPVLENRCVGCHDSGHELGLDFTSTQDQHGIPRSYRTLIEKGLVHYCDYGWNSGGCEKMEPLTFGTVKSRLWEVLSAGHHEVHLEREEVRRIKTWIDLNCPLWPDYTDRTERVSVLGKAGAN